MKYEDFKEGLKIVYSNYGGVALHEEILKHLWKSFGQITPEHWKMICLDIVQNITMRPVVADFYRTFKEQPISKGDERREQRECGECDKTYYTDPDDYNRVCPTCLAWMDTPEGKEINKARREDLVEQGENMGRR